MRHTLLPAVVAATFVVACSSDKPPAPTGPTQLHVTGVPDIRDLPACDSRLAKVVSGEYGNFYTNNAKSEAGARLRQIQDFCGAYLKRTNVNDVTALELAQDSTVAYFGYFLRQKALVPSRVLRTSTDWAHHFNHLVAYVDIDESDYVIEAPSFTNGAVKYCPVDATTGQMLVCQVEFPLLAKLRINAGSTDRPLLATIARAADPTLTGPGDCEEENLKAQPYCARVETTPRVTFASPYVDVAVCHQETLAPRVEDRLEIAHPEPGAADETHIEIGERVAGFTIVCGNSDLSATYGRVAAALRDQGVAGRAFASLGRLAGYTLAALTPTPLYATHTGDGAKLIKISPISPLDPYIFDDRFLVPPLQLGSFPLQVGAEVGQWWDTLKSPGTISVQTSSAFPRQPGEGTLDTVLVLAQAGGNCTSSCGGLFLAGTVSSFPNAGRGIYDVRWESMEEKSSAKEAPFFVRTGPATDDVSSRPTGLALAKLAYKALSSPNMLVLTFNDYVVQGVSWAPGVVQTFTIKVNLFTRKVSFYLNDSATPATVIVDGVPQTEIDYYDVAARSADQKLGQFTAEFQGIDAGTVYIDNVSIFRRPDNTAP